MAQEELVLDTRPLTVDDLRSVAREGRRVVVGDRARAAIERARGIVHARALAPAPIYGINTGFGSLARHHIDPADFEPLQRNLVRSHAAGVGAPLPVDLTRAMLLAQVASLARGHSGVRVDLVERLATLLNHDITPVVPGRGSVGASGDLAPLAHAALLLFGEGEAFVGGRRTSGAEALAAAKLAPMDLGAKEGLALINGTHLMAAMAGLAVADTDHLFAAALCAAALAIDACRASDTPLDARTHDVRRQVGQRHVAAVLREQVAGSRILAAHRENDPRVQDPYSLRAAPQVLGAAWDTIEHVRGVVERELGAVTDNPLVFAEDEAILSGANFHGMPLAIALDVLSIALAHVAGIAERRIFWLLKASDSENPVNPYLSPQPGLHSGMMITQYTAAACASELQTLTTPASVANISTAAGVEDYNSMGATAGHQARAALDLATSVIATELLVMTEAMEYQRPLRGGAGVERTYEIVRAVVPRLTADRPPSPDIEAIATLIRRGAFLAETRTDP